MSSVTAADLASRTRRLLDACHPDDPDVDEIVMQSGDRIALVKRQGPGA